MTEEKLTVVFDHPIDRVDLPGNAPNDNPSFHDRQAFESIRMRHDRALQATKTPVNQPQVGETPAAYERRLTSKLMPHATSFSPMGLRKLPENIFRDIQQKVLVEAVQEPQRNGTLVPVRFKDRSGRQVVEYEGSMGAWMNRFKAPLMNGVIVDDSGRPLRIPVGA